MYLAEVDTSHYGWRATGATEDEALAALREGYRLHAETTGAEPDLMAELIEGGDVTVTALPDSPGCWRDETRLV